MRSDTVTVDSDESPEFLVGPVMDAILEECDEKDTTGAESVWIAVDGTLSAVVDWLIEQGMAAQAEALELARRDV